MFIFERNNNNGPIKNTEDKILAGTFGTIFSGIGILCLPSCYHEYKHENDPLIILDKKGIWHEKWDEKIFWFNIQDITFIKVNEIERDSHGHEWYRGFSWTIKITTKQQKSFLIDERSTQMGESNRFCDIIAGGELGQIIAQHYDKYKIIINTNAKRNTPNKCISS